MGKQPVDNHQQATYKGRNGYAAQEVSARRGRSAQRGGQTGHAGHDPRRDLRVVVCAQRADPPRPGGGREIQSKPHTLYFQPSNQGLVLETTADGDGAGGERDASHHVLQAAHLTCCAMMQLSCSCRAAIMLVIYEKNPLLTCVFLTNLMTI